jgi:hypothetical protein
VSVPGWLARPWRCCMPLVTAGRAGSAAAPGARGLAASGPVRRGVWEVEQRKEMLREGRRWRRSANCRANLGGGRRWGRTPESIDWARLRRKEGGCALGEVLKGLNDLFIGRERRFPRQNITGAAISSGGGQRRFSVRGMNATGVCGGLVRIAAGQVGVSGRLRGRAAGRVATLSARSRRRGAVFFCLAW